MTLIFGNFVSTFTDFATGKIESSKFRAHVNHYTLYFVYLFLAKVVFSYVSMVVFSIVSTRVTATIRRLYFSSVLNQDIASHDMTTSSGAVSLGLSAHCSTIQSGLADKFGLSLQSISTVVAAFIVAFTSQWKLTLVTATIIPATVIIIGATAVFDSKLEESINLTDGDASAVAEEMLGSIRTVWALRAVPRLLAKYQSYLERTTRIGWKRAPILGAQTATYMFMIYAAYALAFWYGIHLFSQGEANNSGTIITTLFSIIIGTNSFSQLAGYLGPFFRITTAATQLFRIIDDQPRVVSRPLSPELEHVNMKESIQFDSVTFAYPLRPTHKTLDAFSLTIPSGLMTALVGPSGSGKSTVVALLERWYDTNKGCLQIGGIDVKDIPLKTLRESIGLVQQEPYLFNASILENVLFGLSENLSASLSEDTKRDMVIHACNLANANEFIEQLPQTYDTLIRGTSLSGGQKQRIAIARAIIGNPPILILDEATSALDPVSERLIQQALDRASQGRTTIAIAHRLSTIRNSDRIVVLDKGIILEEGTHDELCMKSDGLYKRLLDAQELLQDRNRPSQQGVAVNSPIEGHGSLNQLEKYESFHAAPQDIENQSFRKPQTTLSVILRIAYEQSNHWILYIVIFACCIVGGALFPIQALLYANVVSTFQLTGHALISKGDFWALMFFVLAIVVGIAYLGISAISTGLGQGVAQQYRVTYLTNMLHQPTAFFDNPDNLAGKLSSRLITESRSMKSSLESLGVVVCVGVSLFSTVILSLVIGWKLALVAIFGALPFIFGAGLIHEKMENSFEEVANKTFADSVGLANECVQAIRTVKAMVMEPVFQEKFAEVLRAHCQQATKHSIRNMVWFALSDSIDLLCMGLTFWYGGRLLSFHEYTTTEFFIVFVAIVLGAESMGQFFAHSSDISQGVAAARSIYALEEPTLRSLKSIESSTYNETQSGDLPVIQFKNVGFAYPLMSNHRVLQNFNLTVPRGQFIALVGPSGCGKSTTIGLLEQFYGVTEGQILINGIDINSLDTSEVRRHIALVSQEPVLFQGTIKSNILLGCDSELSSDRLDEITKQAQIHDIILSLPDGYETQVGARGLALSGGQKQRVCISRAIAQDADILLLDEATSALDSESERLVQAALLESSKGRTVIAVAHRLSTIQHADMICILQKGGIVESGKHEELISKHGIYYRMCQLQNNTQLD
ncbi:MAG: hypothetical protein M1834_008355 [Cirrosporium novae-zelandiae]|nr:MAG: hypothetical protein M1834_008355 [Cirrosporium novae-zelandiae]